MEQTKTADAGFSRKVKHGLLLAFCDVQISMFNRLAVVE
jgi:hypothetical protein